MRLLGSVILSGSILSTFVHRQQPYPLRLQSLTIASSSETDTYEAPV